MFKSPLHHLSVMALVEGSSLIALVLLAVPLKYAADWPAGVKIIGPIHGALFIWATIALVVTLSRGQLSPLRSLGVFLASLIPFGGLWSHRMMRRQLGKAPAAAV